MIKAEHPHSCELATVVEQKNEENVANHETNTAKDPVPEPENHVENGEQDSEKEKEKEKEAETEAGATTATAKKESQRNNNNTSRSHTVVEVHSQYTDFLQSIRSSSLANRVISISLTINIILLIGKIYASYISKSYAVIASAVDSAFDVLSTCFFTFVRRSIEKHDPAKYPVGKQRMEPVSVVAFASVMAMGALQVVIESIRILVVGFQGDAPSIDFSLAPIVVISLTVGAKLCLWVYCISVSKKFDTTNETVSALAQDHKNDTISNVFTMIAALIATEDSDFWFIDPIVAILLMLLISFEWLKAALKNAQKLTGRAADPSFINSILEISRMHNNRMNVDTVRAYHFGSQFLVEIDVVFSPATRVKESHDISLILQKRIEEIPHVARCFVHTDYAEREYDEHSICQ